MGFQGEMVMKHQHEAYVARLKLRQFFCVFICGTQKWTQHRRSRGDCNGHLRKMIACLGEEALLLPYGRRRLRESFFWFCECFGPWYWRYVMNVTRSVKQVMDAAVKYGIIRSMRWFLQVILHLIRRHAETCKTFQIQTSQASRKNWLCFLFFLVPCNCSFYIISSTIASTNKKIPLLLHSSELWIFPWEFPWIPHFSRPWISHEKLVNPCQTWIPSHPNMQGLHILAVERDQLVKHHHNCELWLFANATRVGNRAPCFARFKISLVRIWETRLPWTWNETIHTGAWSLRCLRWSWGRRGSFCSLRGNSWFLSVSFHRGFEDYLIPPSCQFFKDFLHLRPPPLRWKVSFLETCWT